MSDRRAEISRREVLARVAVGSAAILGGSLATSCRRKVSSPSPPSPPRATPSSRIALGFIGLGTEGLHKNLKVFLGQHDTQVVALCDVDRARLLEAQDLVEEQYGGRSGEDTTSRCAITSDWREVVARDDIDAVVVSTPDHWHVLCAVEAAKAGKDVFCEKPVSLTIHEGRVLSDVMQAYGRIFQTASEIRCLDHFHRACALVRNGRIGKLHTIHAHTYRGHTGDENVRIVEPVEEPVPEGFDYDMWLGQAPEAPYNAGRCHTFFRYNFDYAGGNLADWGAHIHDIVQWGNGTELTGPVSVEGQGVFPVEGLYNVAVDWDIAFEYANGVKLVCSSGGFSVRFEGSDGWVYADWDVLDASSDEILHSRILPEDIHLRTCPEGEHRDFLDCVKNRAQTCANAEIGHRTATIAHLGNIALRLGRKLNWDPDIERFVGDDEADRMLSRSMRSPWRLDA